MGGRAFSLTIWLQNRPRRSARYRAAKSQAYSTHYEWAWSAPCPLVLGCLGSEVEPHRSRNHTSVFPGILCYVVPPHKASLPALRLYPAFGAQRPTRLPTTLPTSPPTTSPTPAPTTTQVRLAGQRYKEDERASGVGGRNSVGRAASWLSSIHTHCPCIVS